MRCPGAGKFVRIAPNHISINDADALPLVYGHGNGTLKPEFYDAFVAQGVGVRGLFNTRDRAEHSRKRKIVSNVFAQKNVLSFEPHILAALEKFTAQWDRMCAAGQRSERGPEQGGWHGDGERVWLDCLPWYNYLAFDIIGGQSRQVQCPLTRRALILPQISHSARRSACSTRAPTPPTPPSAASPRSRTRTSRRRRWPSRQSRCPPSAS